ncbi:MAG: GerW family sporulation protein [Syntrophomonadales bacterium]
MENASGHPIENLMKTAMESIKQMIDVNTVVGDAVETKTGTVIIPISQVSCGFAAGGGEYETTAVTQTQGDGYLPFGGGSGAGVSVKPVGFLIVKDDVRLLTVKGNQLAERVVDLTPQILEKIETLVKGREKEAPVS